MAWNASGGRPRWKQALFGYSLAIVAMAVAAVIDALLVRWLGGVGQAVLFPVAVIVSGYFGGLGPGLFATILGCAMADYFIIPPLHSFGGYTATDAVRLGAFAVSGVLVSAITEALHRARRRAEGKTRALEQIQIMERQLIRELSHERQQLAVILEHMPVAVIMTDRAGRLEYANAEFRRLTGGAEPDRGDQTIPAYEAPLTRALTRGAPALGAEVTLTGAGGAVSHALANAAPIRDSAGEISGAVLALQDITARRQLELERDALLTAERAARGEAERASRIKDEFVATVSHELRTPLNAVLGWAELLKRDPADPALRAEALQAIEHSARAQARLIDDLLDMSRIVAGRLRLKVETTDLRPILQAALDTVRTAAQAKGIELSAAPDPQPVPVLGDPARLEQVFWNLLANAVKFTPRGGRVAVDVECVESQVRVAISDTGQGIRPDFLPGVFDRFRQADSAAAGRQHGLGLGLAIVRYLIEAHGGTVSAASAGDGQGATFTVMLPLNEAVQGVEPADTAPALARDRACSLAGTRVLVVDDEAGTRELVRRILEQDGACVLTAARGDEALALLRSSRPDALVCDISMPEMDGYEVIRRMQQLPVGEGGATPAVALTGLARPEDRRRALQAGFRRHVPKPVRPGELAHIVAELIDAERAAVSTN